MLACHHFPCFATLVCCSMYSFEFGTSQCLQLDYHHVEQYLVLLGILVHLLKLLSEFKQPKLLEIDLKDETNLSVSESHHCPTSCVHHCTSNQKMVEIRVLSLLC